VLGPSLLNAASGARVDQLDSTRDSIFNAIVGSVVYADLRVVLDPSADPGHRALEHESAGITG
jgi:hypothetical protein